jgi:hypothetical protein
MVGPIRVGSARSSRAEGRWRWLASWRRSQREVEITGVEEGKLGVREFRHLVTDGSGFWCSCSANHSPPRAEAVGRVVFGSDRGHSDNARPARPRWCFHRGNPSTPRALSVLLIRHCRSHQRPSCEC